MPCGRMRPYGGTWPALQVAWGPGDAPNGDRGGAGRARRTLAPAVAFPALLMERWRVTSGGGGPSGRGGGQGTVRQAEAMGVEKRDHDPGQFSHYQQSGRRVSRSGLTRNVLDLDQITVYATPQQGQGSSIQAGGHAMTPAPQDATQWLIDWRNGKQEALAHLLPLVYDELRRLAHRYLQRERPDHT